MTRFSGWMVALVATATLAGTGCSGGGARGSGSTTTTSTTTTSTTTTSTTFTTLDPTTTLATSGSTSTRPVSATTLPAGPTTSEVATTLPAGGGPLVATAAGWRMVITQPAPGSTIGSVAVLCYEVTGSSREAVVGFEVTFFQPGSTTSAGTFRADAAVGRGTARVTVTGVPSGRYDVRIQLVLNGSPLEGAAVTTTVNVVAGGTQIATC